MKLIKKINSSTRKFWINFFVPLGIILIFRLFTRKLKNNHIYLKIFERKKYSLIIKNKIFTNKHIGERCFILGTGQSINDINLLSLYDYNKIFLSEFFLHKDYAKINPRYHLFNALGGHPNMPYDLVLPYYQHIDKIIPRSVNLFFWYKHDYNFIKNENLFKEKKIYYIDYYGEFHYLLKDGLDITKHFLNPHGCDMAGIQLAIAMGFKEIFLHGIDYIYEPDQNNNMHFYNHKSRIINQRDFTYKIYKNDFRSEFFCGYKTLEEFYSFYKTRSKSFEDHLILKKFCSKNGIKIFNTSMRSLLLDVYTYRDFNAVI